jgi:outer membrane protein insertion porin family/translocation and assembly module TamA
VTSSDSLEVTRLSFVGARAFSESILATAIVTAPTRCVSIAPLCWAGVGVDRQFLDGLALGADVVRLRIFYYQRGYRDAQITADTVRGSKGVDVTFRIDEGEPVRVISIVYDSAGGLPASLMRNLPLARGAPFSLVAQEAGRDTLIQRLNNLGYARADALIGYTIPHDSPYVAHVRYELIPGERARFGEIEIAGAEKVTPAVVRRMLTFQSGDLYTREALLRSQRNLFGQELFRHAEIRAAPDPETDTLIDVRVQVNEGNLHRVRAGVGLSTAEYVNAEGRWISRSFLGGARRLEVRGSISNLLADQLGQTAVFTTCNGLYCRMSGSIAADFAQPWFFGPLNTLGTGLYFERRTLPQVFVRTAGGGYFTFSRALGIGESMSFGYRPELTKLETVDGDIIFCSNFVACGPREIEALREANWLSPFTFSYVRDRSNSIFAPSRGNQVRFEAEYAGKASASDFAYTRVAFDFVDYSTLARGLILAARLRSGWAHALGDADSALGVHPQKRFFAGGANSVRGFAQFELGPKLLTIDAANRLAVPDTLADWPGCTPQAINDGTCDAAPLAKAEPGIFQIRPVGGATMLEGNIELRFPVFRERLRGAAFLDFGQVWVDQDAIDFGTLAWTPGLGVRYFSPIGPIRIDVGYNPVGAERVNVLTTEVEFCPEPPEGEDPQCEDILPGEVYDYRRLRNKRTLRPLDPVSWNPRDSFLDRLQFHFSIGQAF